MVEKPDGGSEHKSDVGPHDAKIRQALGTLANSPATVDSLMSVSGPERRAKLAELGLGGVTRADVGDFLSRNGLPAPGMAGPSGPGGEGPASIEITRDDVSNAAAMASAAAAAI
jgi:hypothetical protein